MSVLQSMVLKNEKAEYLAIAASHASMLYDMSMDSTLVSRGNLTAAQHKAELLAAQDSCLTKAKKAKKALDKLVIKDIAADTQVFEKSAAELKTVNDEIVKELKALEKMVRTMQDINKFLALVDKGLEIAAGLAKTL